MIGSSEWVGVAVVGPVLFLIFDVLEGERGRKMGGAHSGGLREWRETCRALV